MNKDGVEYDGEKLSVDGVSVKCRTYAPPDFPPEGAILMPMEVFRDLLYRTRGTERYLKPIEAAKLLNVTKTTLRQYVLQELITPVYLPPGNPRSDTKNPRQIVRYKESDIHKLAEQRSKKSADKFIDKLRQRELHVCR